MPTLNRHSDGFSQPSLNTTNSVKPSSKKVTNHPTTEKTARVFVDSFQLKGSTRDGMINERMFAHIHGEGLIEETGLEGNFFENSMDYAEGELSRLESGHYQIEASEFEKGVIREMHTEMKECASLKKEIVQLAFRTPREKRSHELLENLGKELAQSVSELRPGSRKLIPGGWEGKSGHAMLYEVIKVGHDRYEFHVINTGDGSLDYHPTRKVGKSIEAQCCLEYGGLTSQDLNSSFFTDLIAMQVGSHWNSEKYPSGIKHLYEEVLPVLERETGHRIQPCAGHTSWMKPQITGICTWQCIKAWEKSRLNPKIYEHFQLCTKVRTFNEFCSINRERLSRENFMSHLVEHVSSDLGQELARFTGGSVTRVPILNLSEMKQSASGYDSDEDSADLWEEGSSERSIIRAEWIRADEVANISPEVSSERNQSIDRPTSQETECVFTDSFQLQGSTRDVMINETMFAHIHGDGLIGGTPLEGNYFHEVMEYSQGELSRLEKGHYKINTSEFEKRAVKEMRTEMEECAIIEEDISRLACNTPSKKQNDKLIKNLGRELAQSVTEMDPGSRKLIPGGWGGNPGHAMLYEIIKVDDQHYKFHVINTGDGASQYHPVRQVDGNLEVQCCLEYGGLTSQDLNSTFFSKLIAIQIGPAWNSKYPSGPKHLYEQVLPILERGRGHRLNSTPTHPSWMKPQTSRISTWQCIKAWEKSRLSPKTYEHLQLCTKVRTFNEFCSLNAKKLSKDSFMSRLVKKHAFSSLRQELAHFTDGSMTQVPVLNLSEMKQSMIPYEPDPDSADLWREGSCETPVISSESISMDRVSSSSPQSSISRSQSIDRPASQETECVFTDSFQLQGSTRDAMINETMFAHIHGDGLIGGTPLEGNYFHEVMKYSQGELSRLEKGHYKIDTSEFEKRAVKEMRTEMEECAIMEKDIEMLASDTPEEKQNHKLIEKLGKKIARSVAKMKPGSKKLIPGGWQGTPGHAVLYEVTKVSRDLYEFHVINTGDGASEYHPIREVDGSLEAQCCLEYGGLTSKGLSSAFFTNLLSMRIGPNWSSEKYPSGAKQLYEQVLPMLERGGGHLMESSPTHSSWMKPQISRISTWQCIKAWEKSRLSPKTYEHLQLCTKVRTFNEFCSLNVKRLSRKSFMSRFVKEHAFSSLSQELAQFTGGSVTRVPILDLSEMKQSETAYELDEDSAELWHEASFRRPIIHSELPSVSKASNVYSQAPKGWSPSIEAEKHLSRKYSWNLSTPSWFKNFMAVLQKLISYPHSTSENNSQD